MMISMWSEPRNGSILPQSGDFAMIQFVQELCLYLFIKINALKIPVFGEAYKCIIPLWVKGVMVNGISPYLV